jgi:hypothetical protein
MIDSILSIILGLIFGILTMLLYRWRTTKLHGPDSNIVRKTIYKADDKCYQFEPYVVQCK